MIKSVSRRSRRFTTSTDTKMMIRCRMLTSGNCQSCVGRLDIFIDEEGVYHCGGPLEILAEGPIPRSGGILGRYPMHIQRRSYLPADMLQTDWQSLNSRRKFLTGMAAIGAALGLSREVKALQTPADAQKPGPPRPPHSGEPDPSPNFPSLSPEKRILEQNEKEIRKKVGQLYDLATELKAKSDKTDSSIVLTLNMLKKAEEIH